MALPKPKRVIPKTSTDIIGLFLFILLCLLVSAFGGAITSNSVDTWYQEIKKPSFNPPDWVFAPIWIALYILMGIAAWRVWRKSRRKLITPSLVVFYAQLVLNLIWSYLFFGMQRIDLALFEIVILLIVIIANTVLFWRLDRQAGICFLPYVAWVTYAMILNASIWILN